MDKQTLNPEIKDEKQVEKQVEKEIVIKDEKQVEKQIIKLKSYPDWLVPACVGFGLLTIVGATVLIVRRNRKRELEKMRYEGYIGDEYAIGYETGPWAWTKSAFSSIGSFFTGLFRSKKIEPINECDIDDEENYEDFL